jgi:hypothetical protein
MSTLCQIFESESIEMSFPKIVQLGMTKPLKYHIEIPKGTVGRWKKDVQLPFSYGELSGYVNKADGMNWDVISCDKDSTEGFIVGVVKIHPQADAIPKPDGNVPGNHKLILSSTESISDENKELINNYFSDVKSFLKPIYFNKETDMNQVYQENVESATLGKYKLGHFRDESTDGIAVGPTARNQFNAVKYKNNLPRTN